MHASLFAMRLLMRKDSRLSRMLHVLIHMDQLNAPATSEKIASMLNTNPVVVRRTMAGLRDKGYVTLGQRPWRRLVLGKALIKHYPAGYS